MDLKVNATSKSTHFSGILTGRNLNAKRFSPHITVGRADRRVDLKGLFKEAEDIEFCRFRCDRVNVMKSVLTPKGAIHSAIESIPLD